MSVVTIFSGSFCGAEEAAQLVAGELNAKLMRDEDIIGLAGKAGKLSASILRRAMFGRPSIFNQFSHERERAVSQMKLAVAKLLTEEERLVIIGLSSQLASPGISHVLSVCLIAEAKHRATCAARELGLSEKEAMARVHKDDESAVRWLEFFGVSDPWGASRYDILLPMDGKTAAEAAETICKHALDQPLEVSGVSRAAARDFLLAAQVEGALSQAGHTCRDLVVSAKNADVHILVNKKTVRFGKLSSELEGLARQVAGVGGVSVEASPEYYQADVYRRAEFNLPSKVLLVDDEREFVETLSRRLMMRQIGSAVAYDGVQALKLVAEEEPEVLVLDLKMPNVDGFEVLRRIKKDHPEVEVIILTGHGSEADRELCMELGAFAYLKKPVDVDELSEVMQRAQRKVSGEG